MCPLLGVLLFSAALAAQQPDTPSASASPSAVPSVVAGSTIHALVVYKGMPFSTTRTITRTSPSGVTTIFTSHLWRDAEGRERTDTADLSPDGATPASTHTINVFDPVARVSYSWAEQTSATGPRIERWAHANSFSPGQPLVEVWPGDSVQAKLDAMPAGAKASAPPLSARPAIPGVTVHAEDLQPRTLNGLYVTGKRVTIDFPASVGAQPVPPSPNQSVFETWTSPDLHLTVLRITSSTTTGSARSEYTGIRRESPDPSLFAPPASYRILKTNVAPSSQPAPNPTTN